MARQLPPVDVVRVGMKPEGLPGVVIRWVMFEFALIVSVVPAYLGLYLLPQLMEWTRFFTLAWTWQILALAPGGYARIESGVGIWFADTAWALSLLVWLAAGLACAFALRRISLAWFAVLALPLVLAVGTLLHLILRIIGFIPYVGV